MRFAFTGDGHYAGDGGAELERLYSLHRWKALNGCDGRYAARGKELVSLSLAFTRVADLSPLESLDKSLTDLDLRGCALSTDQTAALIECIPALQVRVSPAKAEGAEDGEAGDDAARREVTGDGEA